MKVISKIIVATLFPVISCSAFAGLSADGRSFVVTNFFENATLVKPNLTQSVTGYNQGCGPTSLLFASNYYGWRSTGTQISANMASITASKDTISGLYSYLGKTQNSITSLENLRDIARTKWGWTNVVRMAAANGVDSNVNTLMTALNADQLAVIPIAANYSGNPLPGYDHIVVIFGYSRETDELGRAWNDPNNSRKMDKIHWFEPYRGNTGSVFRKDAGGAFSAAGFSFLKIGR